MVGSNFKQAFLEAVSQAKAAGTIRPAMARRLEWRATESKRADRFLEEMEEELGAELLLTGAVSPTGSFDWMAFIELIIKNLPAIINLFL